MAQIHIEFFGTPRRHAGTARATVSLPGSSVCLGALLQTIAGRYPDWAAACLDEQGRLLPAYLANIDGDCFARDPHTLVSDGQSVLLLGADVGG